MILSDEEIAKVRGCELYKYVRDGELDCGSCSGNCRLIARKAEDEMLRQAMELPNPFIGYVDVIENIRMAKEQGFERYRRELKAGGEKWNSERSQ